MQFPFGRREFLQGAMAMGAAPALLRGGQAQAVQRAAVRDADIAWDPLESTCRHASLSIL